MPRALLAAALLLVLAVPAHAVTAKELVDLSRAGLGDDILIALVEAEKSVFRLSAAEVQELKRQGLSDRVLLHLVQTPSIREAAARVEQMERRLDEPAPPPPVRAADPDVVYVDRVETIAVPVYVPIVVAQPRPEKPAKPVYWGWGGKRRPDAWKEPDKQR